MSTFKESVLLRGKGKGTQILEWPGLNYKFLLLFFPLSSQNLRFAVKDLNRIKGRKTGQLMAKSGSECFLLPPWLI